MDARIQALLDEASARADAAVERTSMAEERAAAAEQRAAAAERDVDIAIGEVVRLTLTYELGNVSTSAQTPPMHGQGKGTVVVPPLSKVGAPTSVHSSSSPSDIGSFSSEGSGWNGKASQNVQRQQEGDAERTILGSFPPMHADSFGSIQATGL